jgi:hypothetical protein
MAQQKVNDVEQETLKMGEEVVTYCKQYEGTDKYNVAMLAIEFGYQLALKQQQTALTEYQKLLAFEYKYYNFISWNPKEGDYYTSTRADLELYKVVKITDDKIFTIYCSNPSNIFEWDRNSFLTEGFGLQRMYVPDFVFKH